MLRLFLSLRYVVVDPSFIQGYETYEEILWIPLNPDQAFLQIGNPISFLRWCEQKLFHTQKFVKDCRILPKRSSEVSVVSVISFSFNRRSDSTMSYVLSTISPLVAMVKKKLNRSAMNWPFSRPSKSVLSLHLTWYTYHSLQQQLLAVNIENFDSCHVAIKAIALGDQ